MNFHGFDVTPVGNAKVQMQEGRLVVSNIDDSGLDEVLVKKTKNTNDNYKIVFSKSPDISRRNSFVKYTTLFKNRLDFPFTFSERIVWYDPKSERVVMGYNHELLPKRFDLVGYLDGEVVFDIEVDKDDPPAPVFGPVFWYWFQIAGGFAGMITFVLEMFDRLSPTSESLPHYYLDPHDGRCHKIGYIDTEDPEPFEVYVDNKAYTVNQVGIKFEQKLDPPLPAGSEHTLPTSYGTMITAANIGSFTISSIERIPPAIHTRPEGGESYEKQ